MYAYASVQEDNLSMDCDVNNITYEYERMSIVQGQSYNLMTSINNSLNPVFVDLNLSKREGGASEKRKSVYWKLQIPWRTGGVCNGKVVFYALSG